MSSFQEKYNNLKNVPIEELKINLEANVYGATDSWARRAAEYIIKEHEKREERARIDRDFDLTKNNVIQTRRLAGLTLWLAIATIVIAGASVLGYLTQLKSVAISQAAENRDKIRLQAELRPYLIVELGPGDGEYLWRDDNSHLYCSIYDGKFLILPLIIKNVGKLPAINIKADYVSPVQQDKIELGENMLSPDGSSMGPFRPWINISDLITKNYKGEFKVILSVHYMGNKEIDPRTHVSNLFLQLKRIDGKKPVFEILSTNFEFAYDK